MKKICVKTEHYYLLLIKMINNIFKNFYIVHTWNFFCQQFIIYIVNRCFMCFYRKILLEKKNIKLLFGDFQKKKISIHHSVSRIILGNIMEHVSKYFWNTFSPKFLLLITSDKCAYTTYLE